MSSSPANNCPECGLPLPVSTTGEPEPIECPHCAARHEAEGLPVTHEAAHSPDNSHHDLDFASEDPQQYDLGPSARYPQYQPRSPGTGDDDEYGDIVEIDEETGEVVAPASEVVPSGSQPPRLPPQTRRQGSDDFKLVVADDGDDEYELDYGDSRPSHPAPVAVAVDDADLIDNVDSATTVNDQGIEGDVSAASHEAYEIEPAPMVFPTAPPAVTAPPVQTPVAPPVQQPVAADAANDDGDPQGIEGPAVESPADPPESAKPQSDEEPVYIPIKCRICNTRFYAVPAQVGQSIECPDCFAQNVVPPPEVRKTKPKPPVAVAEDHYELTAPVERPTLETLGYQEIFEKEKSRPRAAKGEARREDVEAYAPPKTPKAPFTLGVYDYPVYPELRVPWIGLSAGLLPVIYAGWTSYDLFMGGDTGAIGGLLLAFVTLVIGAVWAAAASSTFLAIVESTSEGLDDLGASAENDWFDRFHRAFYVVSALMFSVLPGWLPLQLVGSSLLVTSLVGLATGWFLFPLVLLSMLEANSPFVPYSRPVWQSLSLGQSAWRTFYFATALVALAGYFAVATATVITEDGRLLAFIIAVAVVVGAAMIYFRLLGRLALVCSEFISLHLDDDDNARHDEDEMAD